jgi:iron complex transport system permease protein
MKGRRGEREKGRFLSPRLRVAASSRLLFGGLIFLLILILLLAVALGSENLSFFELNESQKTILWEIRLPRVLLAASVGASLAAAGAGFQALLRNPLAEPYLLGVSNGAALGTMFAFVFFGQFEFLRPVMAFGGAVLATVAVYQMAKSRAGMNAERLVLSGVIVTTFLSSVIVLLTTLLDATKLRSFTFWLLGDLSQATPNSFYLAGLTAIIGTLILTATARSLNLMMLGERDAFDFGVEVQKIRLIVFATASALVGISVASSGSVGYVGLVVPHLVRLTIGSDNRNVIPATAIVGASFVVLADTIARTAIAPRELPVGAITALIGAPMFIYLLRKS